jgi:hypothetical protein
VRFLRGVFDVRVDEERVCLTVDVFDSKMEAVEASGFRRCDFGREVATEILIDDAV